MPILSSLDTNGMPKGYPDEEKYLAFIESLLTDEGQDWRRSVLMEGRKNFQRICERGWQDKDGGFIGNWRRYARGCIAKEFEEVAHRILNWDDALISVADVEPPEVVGLKPYSRPSKPAEQPRKPLPPPSKSHVSPFDADPMLARQLKVHEIRRAREEAERRRLMGLSV